jgi:SAM-dependent methyltransferase
MLGPAVHVAARPRRGAHRRALPRFLGALPRLLGAVGPQLPNLLEAHRGGGGVSWAALGDDAREAQAALNRPWFESQLATALNSCVNVREILTAPRTRIADVGCGAGWSTIALAKAYPHAELVGFDIDPPSIEIHVRRRSRRASLVASASGWPRARR